MEKSRMVRIDGEFDKWLNTQLEILIKDCEALGISKRKVSKVKATNLLVKRLKDKQYGINLKLL